MCNTLKVQWTVIPLTAPQPWIVCNGCGGLKPFKSSNKLRLNANGKRLDAWLIYRCLICDKTWNRAIFERQNVRSFDPVVLEALQSNDPAWILKHAFDVNALKRYSQRIDTFADSEIEKTVVRYAEDWTRLEITILVPLTVNMRLDRLRQQSWLSPARLFKRFTETRGF